MAAERIRPNASLGRNVAALVAALLFLGLTAAGCSHAGAAGRPADGGDTSASTPSDEMPTTTAQVTTFVAASPNMSARVLDDHTIQLDWTWEGSNPREFVLSRSVAGGDYSEWNRLTGGTRSVTAAFERCGGAYRFLIRAVTEAGLSASSVSGPIDVCNMVLVPAGPAQVGCDPGVDPNCNPEEMPVHTVTLSSYWIDRTEVSFAAYQNCVNAGVCAPSPLYDAYAIDDPTVPVLGVTWDMAQDYCEWVGKHLPTEAEWEKAGRGETASIYPWGNTWDPTLANWDDHGAYDGFAAPAPVTAFSNVPSPYGAINLTGNVWEWVWDWYSPDYFANSPETDPTGPSEGTLKIVKGGAWKFDFYETMLRLVFRDLVTPNGLSDHVGFRCSRS